MNPIQLQLQPEASLPQSQPKEADRPAQAGGSSFESELKKAGESASARTERPAPERERNVAEAAEETPEEVAKNEPKKSEKTADGGEATVEDISEKVQQIQLGAGNAPIPVPSELPAAYESCVVDAEISDDGGLGLALLPHDAEAAMVAPLARGEADVPPIDLDDILAKAMLIDEKAERSEAIAAREIENIQNLAEAELGPGALDETRTGEAAAVFPEGARAAQGGGSDAPVMGGAKIAVHDMRTKKPADSGLPAEKIVPKADGAETKADVPARDEGGAAAEMALELSSQGAAEQNITSSSAQTAGANGSTFQAMLSNAVQANAPEIVKMGNMVLKDNNSGSINLILKPESLGSVKISLSLSDKLVSGQITVASKEAMDAFRESIDSIRQAFTESGFETGSFDLSFSQGDGFAQNPGRGGSDGTANQLRAERTYGEFLTERGGDGALEPAGGFADGSVNIVA